jgi:hypothetical protein
MSLYEFICVLVHHNCTLVCSLKEAMMFQARKFAYFFFAEIIIIFVRRVIGPKAVCKIF